MQCLVQSQSSAYKRASSGRPYVGWLGDLLAVQPEVVPQLLLVGAKKLVHLQAGGSRGLWGEAEWVGGRRAVQPREQPAAAAAGVAPTHAALAGWLQRPGAPSAPACTGQRWGCS